MSFTGDYLKYNNTEKNGSKVMKRLNHANTHQKKEGIPMLILDKMDFK